MPAEPISVYRCFDASGRLLYVGQSINPAGRLRDEHSRRFSGQLTTITITWHRTKDEALAAEKEAIQSDRPLYNISPGITRSGLPRFRTADGSFDRTAYQRELMRKRRAAQKAKKD